MLKYLQNRCFRPKYRFYMTFYWKIEKNRFFFLLRGSFYIILGIQNQFSGIQNSKFYEILHNFFLIKKSIFIYKNRFLDLKRVSFRPNANTTISGKKGLPTLFARPYIKSWLYPTYALAPHPPPPPPPFYSLTLVNLFKQSNKKYMTTKL